MVARGFAGLRIWLYIIPKSGCISSQNYFPSSVHECLLYTRCISISADVVFPVGSVSSVFNTVGVG